MSAASSSAFEKVDALIACCWTCAEHLIRQGHVVQAISTLEGLLEDPQASLLLRSYPIWEAATRMRLVELYLDYSSSLEGPIIHVEKASILLRPIYGETDLKLRSLSLKVRVYISQVYFKSAHIAAQEGYKLAKLESQGKWIIHFIVELARLAVMSPTTSPSGGPAASPSSSSASASQSAIPPLLSSILEEGFSQAKSQSNPTALLTLHALKCQYLLHSLSTRMSVASVKTLRDSFEAFEAAIISLYPGSPPSSHSPPPAAVVQDALPPPVESPSQSPTIQPVVSSSSSPVIPLSSLHSPTQAELAASLPTPSPISVSIFPPLPAASSSSTPAAAPAGAGSASAPSPPFSPALSFSTAPLQWKVCLMALKCLFLTRIGETISVIDPAVQLCTLFDSFSSCATVAASSSSPASPAAPSAPSFPPLSQLSPLSFPNSLLGEGVVWIRPTILHCTLLLIASSARRIRGQFEKHAEVHMLRGLNLCTSRIQQLELLSLEGFSLDSETLQELSQLLVLRFHFLLNQAFLHLTRGEMVDVPTLLLNMQSMFASHQPLYSRFRFDVHIVIGAMAILFGKPQEAMQHFHVVAKQGTAAGRPECAAWANALKAICCLMFPGQFAQSVLVEAHTALQGNADVSCQSVIASLLRFVDSFAYFSIGDSPHALASLRSVLQKVNTESGCTQLGATVLGRLSEHYAALPALQQAMDTLSPAIHWAHRLKDPVTQSSLYTRMADVHKAKGAARDADIYASKIVKLAKDFDRKLEFAETSHPFLVLLFNWLPTTDSNYHQYMQTYHPEMLRM